MRGGRREGRGGEAAHGSWRRTKTAEFVRIRSVRTHVFVGVRIIHCGFVNERKFVETSGVVVKIIVSAGKHGVFFLFIVAEIKSIMSIFFLR